MKSSVLKSYVLFALRTLLPLVVLPILSHRLGASGFGSALAAQSLGLLGSLVVQFGFHHSVTRMLGLAEGQRDTDEIIGRVLAAQIITSLLAASLMLAGVIASQGIGAQTGMGISVVLIGLGVGLSPAWYFRGTGRAPTGIMLELAGQIISFLAIIVFVNTVDDLVLAVFLIGIGPSLSALFGLGWMLFERKCLIWPSFSATLHQISGGFTLFLVRASSTGMTMGAAWFASLLMAPAQVAYFGVAAKIASALTTMSQPILFSLLPVASRRARDGHGALLKLAAKWGLVLVCLGLFSAISVQIFADVFLSILFAPDMAAAAPVTRLLVWVCVLSAFRDALSDLVLIPMHKDRAVLIGTVVGAAFTLILAIVFVSEELGWNGANGMAIARLIGEAVTVALLGFFLCSSVKRLGRPE